MEISIEEMNVTQYRPVRKIPSAQCNRNSCSSQAALRRNIIRLLIHLAAVTLPNRTSDRRATRLTRCSRESRCDEFRVRVHVNCGQVPEERVTGLGILELEDTGLALGGGHLD